MRPNNIWEYGAVVFAVQYTYFIHYIVSSFNLIFLSINFEILIAYLQQNDPSIFKFSYEELLDDTETYLKKILDWCGVSTNIIDESKTLDCLNKDSQVSKKLILEFFYLIY